MYMLRMHTLHDVSCTCTNRVHSALRGPGADNLYGNLFVDKDSSVGGVDVLDPVQFVQLEVHRRWGPVLTSPIVTSESRGTTGS